MLARKLKIAAIAIVVLVATSLGMRLAFGRDRADLAALFSFDEGTLWAFSQTYYDGTVGPVHIGEGRQPLKAQLFSDARIDSSTRLQFADAAPEWRFALPAQSGGYIIYTVNFQDDRVLSVEAFYSAFAGL